MINKLPDSLRNEYLRKAEEKISKDNKETLEFIKSKGLTVSFERCSTENEAQHIYNIARDMWQADGYYDPPTGFTKISEKESRLANALLGIKMSKEPKPPRTCCRTHWEEDTQRYAVGKDGVLWNPWGMPFMTCKVCGCKRCPKATDCFLECTRSNEPGQLGSIYGTPLPPKELKDGR